MARLAAARLRDAGIDPGPLLEQAGLTSAQVADVGAWVDAGRQVRFLNLAADALPDTMLGFHLAREFDIRQAGMLYFVLASSPNLGEAFARAARYSAVANESITLSAAPGNGTGLRFGYSGVPRHVDRHQMEFWITALVRICRHLSGMDLRPVRISVTHPRFHGSEAFEDFLRCKVSFRADPGEVDEIVFAGGVDALPVQEADPYLSQVMVSQCEQATARHARVSGSLRQRVENEIVQALPHGRALMDEVARTLGMSKRTLARRLSEEGVSYMEILEDVRVDMAEHYLRNSHLPISEIAWLLGYAETSAFTNSFRRWTGSTPRHVRKAH
jgi:AraC-like DNA-binding protein